MARGTSMTAFRTEAPQPIWLLDLQTGLSGAHERVRICDYDGEVLFGAITYVPRGFEVGPIAVESHNETAGVDVRILDADGWWQANVIGAGAELGNRAATLYRLDVSGLPGGAGGAAVREDFYVESWERAEGYFTLRLRSLLSIFDLDVPRTTMTRTEFPGIPGVR